MPPIIDLIAKARIEKLKEKMEVDLHAGQMASLPRKIYPKSQAIQFVQLSKRLEIESQYVLNS